MDGLKLAVVLVTGATTIADSFVSVKLADVSRVRCTLPEGALAPLKVTGSVAVRCRLKTTSEFGIRWKKRRIADNERPATARC